MGLFDKNINGINVLVTSGGVKPISMKIYEVHIWIDDNVVKKNITHYNIKNGMTPIDLIELLDIKKQRMKKLKKLMNNE